MVSKTVWKDSSGSELLCFQTSSTVGLAEEKKRLRGSTHIKSHKSIYVRENKVSLGISTCLNALVPYVNNSDIHYHNEL